MAGLGRVLLGGKDRGAGFALGSRLAITAYHVVRDRGDKPVVFAPAGGSPLGVERVLADVARDAAILWLAGDVEEFLPVAAAVGGAEWRVESPPPGGNDPQLHGTVTVARMTIQNASGQPVEVVQLEVGEQLGDYGGYSGSAVLDELGRAVLALLVEQMPLRTPVALAERSAASNVLYAVPISDVIKANGLQVQTSWPLRFDVGLQPPGMVARSGLLDTAVGLLVGTGGLVLLRGPGGVGKTVLARQVAKDVRVWAEFADGIIMLRAGEGGTADSVARQLQETLGYRDLDLAGVLAGQRLLLIVDDVWDQGLLTTLRANLPPTVALLATTRGASAPGALAVPVGAVSQDEAIEILARDTARSDRLDRVLGDLADTLFGWALLLTLAAAELHRDDELGWGVGDEDSSQSGTAEPDVLIGRAETLKTEFPDDPTMLDDLERTPEAAPTRSVDVLVRRSLDWLGPEQQARFELLAIYPPSAEISQPMLEDLWETSPNATRKVISLLVRAGLAQPVRREPLTIELHDLITAWLHHERGGPGDARHQPVHLRLAGLSLLPDGSPGALTKDRAEWLAYHLVAAGAWDRLKALPTLRWRSAFLVATGSDAAFLGGLDHYGHAALAQAAPEAVYHAVRAWLFAAHVRTLIGRLPISVLVAMALVGDPIAAITQASQHPEAQEAMPAVLAALANGPDVHLLLDRAAALARTIPDDGVRSRALAAIAEQLAATETSNPVLIEQALAVARTIPDDGVRSRALAAIAEQLAATETSNPVLIEQALAVARTIPDDGVRSRALAAIAEQLAATETSNPVLIEQALAVARTIPDDGVRSRALAAIAQRLAATDPALAVALIEQALAVARTIPDDGVRSRALAAIAQRLAATDPALAVALIEQALAVARTIPDDGVRSRALAAIAQRLPAADPPNLTLIRRILAVAQTIPDREWRARALAAIAQRLAAIYPPDPALIKWALALARTIPDAVERIKALGTIAEWLAVADSPNLALIEQALGMAGATPNPECYRALAAIAERLAAADPSNPALIEQALGVAQTLPDREWRARALAAIAERLADVDSARAAALIEQALAVAQTLPEREWRARALGAIAQRLADVDSARAAALIEQALTVAETIPDDGVRSSALAAIAERLADVDPAPASALIEQALAVAQTLPDRQRDRALAAIAERLTAADPSNPALIKRALTVAETIPDDGVRSSALAAIAERLADADPAPASALIEQALAVAQTLPDRQRERVLTAIAVRLAAADLLNRALVDQALAMARTLLELDRGGALAAIAEQLAAADPSNPALVDQALAMARTLPELDRSGVLAAIAEQLAAADPSNPALIKRALAVARTIRYDWYRSEALAAIAQRLAVSNPARAAALINQALARVRTIPDDWQRSSALAAIAERLAAADPPSPALIDQALAVAEAIPDDGVRSSALAAIAERLAAADPPSPALIDQALAVAEAIPDDGVRSSALAAIAERLAAADPPSPALIDQALAVAEAIPDDGVRSSALAAIAERLAAADPPNLALIKRVLAMARTIPDDQIRTAAVARIHALTRSGMLDEMSRWRLRPVVASIGLLTVFLGNCHDKTIAESIGHAVLDVAVEFSA